MLFAILRGVRRASALLLVATLALLGCGAEDSSAKKKTIVTGLHVPWGIAFLPGGDALIAERTTGKIVRVDKRGKHKRTVMTVPGVDTDAGEGGLLGLAVSPNYRSDGLIYVYFTSSRDNRIVRGKLGGPLRPILTGLERGLNHNGGRIAFGPDGKLYAGVGEAGEQQLAQNRGSQNGKILRMNPDGSVPGNNPFGSRVWSYGHRNVQGLAWDRSRRLWATEFGQDEVDEVNLIRKGRNYGWPVREGNGSTDGGRFTNPKVTWRPTSVSSPSGAAIIGRTLYVGALQCRCVWRIPLRGTHAGRPRRTVTGYGRIRTVAKAPDGSLWVSTSNRDGRGSPRAGDDRIIRVSR